MLLQPLSKVLVPVIIIISFFCNGLPANKIQLPAVPCPNIFKYQFDGNNYVGIITLRNMSYGQTTVQVKMAYPGNVNHDFSGMLLLESKKDKIVDHINSPTPIIFKAEFPHENAVPRLVDISVNDVNICSGSKDHVNPFVLNNTFTMKHTLTVNADSSNESKRTLKPVSRFRRYAQQNPFLRNARSGYVPPPPSSNTAHGNPFLSNAISGFGNPFQYVPQTVPSMQHGNPFLTGAMNRFSHPAPQPARITARIEEYQSSPVKENPFLKPSMSRFGGQTYTVPQPPPPTNFNPPSQENPFLKNAVYGSRDSALGTAPRTPTIREQFSKLHSDCGLENTFDVRGLIANGQPMPKSRFPWIVAIYVINTDDDTMKFKCGGNLISTKTVISAAHCFKDGLETIEISKLLLSIGRHNLSEWEEAINIGVEQLIIHPDYRKVQDSLDADLAVVLLKKSVSFSSRVHPICLWQGPTGDREVEGTIGSIVGWGEDMPRAGISPVPRMVNATIVSELTCIKSNHQLYYLTTNRTLCAGNRDGSGPCKGDSGSGLMVRIGNKWMLRAIVSASLADEGLECNLNEYVIFSDIAKFILWIKSHMII